MKKMIALVLCLVLALSTVGCENSNMETNNEEIHYDYPPMVMFNDILYSAASYQGTTDSLTLVGKIESYVSDRPTENNQANDNLVGCEIYTTTSAPEYIFVLYNGSYSAYKTHGSDEKSKPVVSGADMPNNSESVDIEEKQNAAIEVREDVCELYLEVLEDLWNVDSGLNSEISHIGIDLSELSHLTEVEKDTAMSEFASKHNLPYIVGTWEELCEQGYIDKDNLCWEDGLFFSIKTNEEAVWNLPAIKEGDSVPELTSFDAQKWRSGLGAYYFGQCTAQKNADGTWSYTVGQEAIS